VILRPYSAGFSEVEFYRLYRWSQDEEVLRWSGGTSLKMSLAEFKHMVYQDVRTPNSHRAIYVILTYAHEMIGRLGLFNLDSFRRQAELGIVIGEKAYWGLGYGSDALQTLLNFVFTQTNLQRIYLSTYANNIRAQRSFIKCGFHPSANSRPSLWDFRHPDEMQMEITKADWSNCERGVP